jgi:hypothetical protein
VTSRLLAISIDALDPVAVEAFWSALLGDDPGFVLRFRKSAEPKVGHNQAHFDVTSTSLEDQQALVDLALALGGRPYDVGQTGEEPHVVLADPEGNEFCAVEPDNGFLADTARIGALSCDGTQAVGYFWSAALGWPLVWDQDEETAIQSPDGGPKISWGGPPLRERTGRNRVHLELEADDPDAEVERLVGLGAHRIGRLDTGAVELTDPDGNSFRVYPTETASALLDDSP